MPEVSNNASFKIRGRVIAINMDGGPLNGPHMVIEVPSAKYPARMPHTEGSLSGNERTTWVLPMSGSKDHYEWRPGRMLLNEAVTITVAVDPDAPPG